MSLKKLIEYRHTLAMRLTLWYAGIFTCLSCVAFILFYLLFSSALRQQIDSDLAKRTRQLSILLALQGRESIQELAVMEAQAEGEEKVFYRFLYPSGEIFSSSNMSFWEDIEVNPSAIQQLLEGRETVFETVSISGRLQTARILYAIIGPGMVLQMGQSMENYVRFVDAFKRIFISTMAMLILLAAFVGWFMAKRALRGVAEVTQTARRISSGNLDERVPVKTKGDEIDQLALTFNRMVDRIQLLITSIREMSDNIAHDLKSPITRIRGLAEVTLTTGKSKEEFEQMAASNIEECDRLLEMINTMLLISKTETGIDSLERTRMDLAQVVRDACALFVPSAEDKHIELQCDAPQDIEYTGDIRMIQRMVANLVDNAIKYTPRGGRIGVHLKARGQDSVELKVVDTGAGIAPEELPHIFERFYRCDRSRSQAGTGLGLSLARAVATAHHGTILADSTPDKGSEFSVRLPLSRTNITK